MESNNDDRLWAALSYLPFLWPIVSIVMLLWEEKKNRSFIKYHAVQSIAVGVAAYLLSFVCVGFLVFLYMFYLAYLAYQGQTTTVPVITDFIKKQGWA